MRINNNIAAANASRNLGETNSKISKNVEKLSTGYRINRAGDDASGLVISNQLRAQTSGLRQAVRNAQDGVSVLQTAEGALDQVNTMLNRMRDLAVQAGNSGTNSQAARQAGQAEVAQLRTEVDRIASTTKFGSLNLLDGSFGINNAKASGFLSAATITIGAASNTLTLTFAGAVTGNVTATLTAGTYTGAQLATEVQRAVKAAMLGGTTASIQAASNNVTVTATSVGGGGTALSLDIGGFAATQTFSLSGTATGGATPASGFQALTSSAASGSGGLFQVGANASETVALTLSSMSSSTLGLAAIDISAGDTSVATALTALDTAINTVSTSRGTIGAMQNRFESMISNLQVTTENLAASESRIRDTDMASEMVEFTKNQVLSQAGTAMLAQANQIPQGILSLL
ncbi:MAG: flagellin, partial [Actinomycetota bacterium]